jgi:hypothetical protein
MSDWELVNVVVNTTFVVWRNFEIRTQPLDFLKAA